MSEHINTGLLIKQDEHAELDNPQLIGNLSVDNLIFAMHESKLKVLLVKYQEGLAANKWGLIGHWVQMTESLNDAAARVVKKVTGVDNLYLEQLGAFGELDRYPLKRIVTIAYYSLVLHDEVNVEAESPEIEVAWFDVYDLPEMIFDHKDIVDAGMQHLKYKVRHEPIGFNLLPQKFTLLQLQEIYEAILGIKLDKPNFRRKILKMNLLIDCKEKQQNVAHRAANLYRFDIHVYDKLKEFGFSFEY